MKQNKLLSISISMLCASTIYAQSITNFDTNSYKNSIQEFYDLNNKSKEGTEKYKDILSKSEYMFNLTKYEHLNNITFQEGECNEKKCDFSNVLIRNKGSDSTMKKAMIELENQEIKNIYIEDFENARYSSGKTEFLNIGDYEKAYDSYFKKYEINSFDTYNNSYDMKFKTTPIFFNLFYAIDKNLVKELEDNLLKEINKGNSTFTFGMKYDKESKKGIVTTTTTYSDLLKVDIKISVSNVFRTNNPISSLFGDLAILIDKIEVKIDRSGLNKYIKNMDDKELQTKLEKWKMEYLKSEKLNKKIGFLNKYKQKSGDNLADLWINELSKFDTFDKDFLDITLEPKKETLVDTLLNLSLFLQTGNFFNYKSLDNIKVTNNLEKTNK